VQNGWAEMKFFFHIHKVPVNIWQNKILKMPKNFKHQKCPSFLGRNEKNSTFITFPGRLKFSKLPKIFPSILEKKIL